MSFFLENFDTIFKLFSVGAAMSVFFFALRSELTTLKVDVNHIKENQRQLTEAITQLNSILTKIAVQDVRINMIEKGIDEMRHGKGMIG